MGHITFMDASVLLVLERFLLKSKVDQGRLGSTFPRQEFRDLQLTYATVAGSFPVVSWHLNACLSPGWANPSALPGRSSSCACEELTDAPEAALLRWFGFTGVSAAPELAASCAAGGNQSLRGREGGVDARTL